MSRIRGIFLPRRRPQVKSGPDGRGSARRSTTGSSRCGKTDIAINAFEAQALRAIHSTDLCRRLELSSTSTGPWSPATRAGSSCATCGGGARSRSCGRSARMGWMAKYHLSLIDLEVVAARVAEQMRGWSEREFAERCRRWVEDDVLPLRRCPSALRRIERHRAEGHVLAILSSSPTYVTRPIAEALGIEEVMSTQFEVTGRALHRPPGRPGLRRPGQGPLGRGPGRAAPARPRRRAGSTPTRTPTCRCWSGSATRWWSTPTRA